MTVTDNARSTPSVVDLPSAGGSYILVLRASAPARLTIGRLGEVAIVPGWYLYVGSALGAGGLRGRLRHHLQPVRRPHWHIDYLRQVCAVTQVWCVVDARRWEHRWAHLLAEMASPAPRLRFGASDCDCVAHCFYWQAQPLLSDFLTIARRAFPDLPEMISRNTS